MLASRKSLGVLGTVSLEHDLRGPPLPAGAAADCQTEPVTWWRTQSRVRKVEDVMAPKTTGSRAASRASSVLSSPSTGRGSRTAAGSALSQVGTPSRTTSAAAASAASRTLSDGRSSAASRSAAASALAQRSRKR